MSDARRDDWVLFFEAEGDGWVLLTDRSAQHGGPTITNAAEDVVALMHVHLRHLGRPATTRIFYRDTDGKVDELLHDGAGRFTGFRDGHEGVDLASLDRKAIVPP